MTTAKNRSQFVTAWQSHRKQLATLALQAADGDPNRTFAEYEQVTRIVDGWIEAAATRLFPDTDLTDDDEPSIYKPEAAVLYDGTPGSATLRKGVQQTEGQR